MNYKKVFWGFILVLLGVLLVLKNLGVLWFSWHTIWHLWPVLLILWGVSLLPVRDLYKVVISILIIILSVIFLPRLDKSSDDNFHWDSDWEDEISTGVDNQKLSEPFDSTIRVAYLMFDAAAGKFRIGDTTGLLIDLNKSGIVGNYSMEIGKEGDSTNINIAMHGQKNIHNSKGNNVELKLNTRPEWALAFDIGAAEVDLDMSSYRLKDLEIDGGACSLDIKLGALQPQTNVNIETGVSSIILRIPKEAGCEVKFNSFMTGKELEGFAKSGDDNYQTANFKTAAQKIYVEMDAAMSSLKVEKY